MKTTATITIVGAGVIGAAIAYELSRALSASIVVLEARSETEFAATGAALGVLIVQLSRRRRGRNFQLRQASLARYDTLIPELEAATGLEIPYQRRGILEVMTTAEAAIATQSWLAAHSDPSLEWLEPAAVVSEFPMINPQVVHGALWAKGDRQVHPRRLTEALRQAAQQQGVEFWYHSKVLEVKHGEQPLQLRLETGTLTTEYLILAAGLGTTPLTQQINHPVLLQPVLGQALEFGWAAPPTLPVLTAEDLHLVPIDPQRVWVGATVEGDRPTGDPHALATLREQASHLWPALKNAPLLRHWQGLRPRPCDRPAPVIEQLQPRVWVASGHYRNGILLAPITAQLVRQTLEGHLAGGKGHGAQQPASENLDTKTSP
ncbi:NAD(P)/FAD-dependent oxidoreductase [Parathermosynechococcus lividus]